MDTAGYDVSIFGASPRMIAAVHARVNMRDVPSVFGRYLDQVYAAGREGAVQLDGQNVFLYRNIPGRPREVDASFGVGIKSPFAPVGNVQPTPLPVGSVATTTHIGPYSMLGAAHNAVIEWCRIHHHAITGTRWEVYGHWKDGETPRTDVYYLLRDVDP